jgi:hypothetical protein
MRIDKAGARDTSSSTVRSGESSRTTICDR